MKQYRMLIGVLMLMFCVTGRTESSPLSDFESLMSALKSGEQVRVVIHYGSCRLISDNREQEKVPDAIGGMMLDTFEYFAPGSIGNKMAFVTSSHTQLIQHPRRGMIYNYAKIRVESDGSVRIVARYLTPDSLTVVMDECFYTTIANGKGKGAAHFFLVK